MGTVSEPADDDATWDEFYGKSLIFLVSRDSARRFTHVAPLSFPSPRPAQERGAQSREQYPGSFRAAGFRNFRRTERTL